MQCKNVMLALRNVTAQTRFLRENDILSLVFGLLCPRNRSDWSVSCAVGKQTHEIFKRVCSEKFRLDVLLNHTPKLQISAINSYNLVNWEVCHAS